MSTSMTVLDNMNPYFCQRCFFQIFYGLALYQCTFGWNFLSETQLSFINTYMGFTIEAVLILLSIYLTYLPSDLEVFKKLLFVNCSIIFTNVTYNESFRNIILFLISLVPILSSFILFIKRNEDKIEFALMILRYLIANTLNYFYRERILENYDQFNQDLFIWGIKLTALISLTSIHFCASNFLITINEFRLAQYIDHFQKQKGMILFFIHKVLLVALVLVCLTLFWIFDKVYIDDGKWADVFEVIVIFNYCLPVALLLRFPQPDSLSFYFYGRYEILNVASTLFSFLVFRSFPLIYSHIKDYYI